MSTVQKLTERNLAHPPKWLPLNIHYETLMGSLSYGIDSDSSDTDIYGWAIPPKEMVFPHLQGEVFGFGKQIKRFEQYQEHHIDDPTALAGKGKTFDVQIYNIVKYFQLCMENNPNMIDSLFTPERCILHITRLGQIVKDNRKIFLHKGAWHKFKGYGYSQVHKLKNKNSVGKRKETVDKFGYNVKFGYHVVRLLNEVEQILVEGDLDIQKNREQLKSIRRGEWSEESILKYFEKKEKELETVYLNSKLPYAPDEEKIKTLLISVLEEHYGNLKECVVIKGLEQQVLSKIREILDDYSSKV